MLTDTELLTLIQSDATALQIGSEGRLEDCAVRLRQILPPETRSARVTSRSLFDVFPDPNDAEAILSGLEALAETNPLIARVLKWMQPSEGGIDIGNATVRGILGQLAIDHPTVFTGPRVAALFALGEQPTKVTDHDVYRALKLRKV